MFLKFAQFSASFDNLFFGCTILDDKFIYQAEAIYI